MIFNSTIPADWTTYAIRRTATTLAFLALVAMLIAYWVADAVSEIAVPLVAFVTWAIVLAGGLYLRWRANKLRERREKGNPLFPE